MPPLPKKLPSPSTNGAINRLATRLVVGGTKARPTGLDAETDLIGAIQRDIATVGLVGEGGPALLVYAAYSSRKLKKPLSVIVRGPSGSGKDVVQRKPA